MRYLFHFDSIFLPATSAARICLRYFLLEHREQKTVYIVKRQPVLCVAKTCNAHTSERARSTKRFSCFTISSFSLCLCCFFLPFFRLNSNIPWCRMKNVFLLVEPNSFSFLFALPSFFISIETHKDATRKKHTPKYPNTSKLQQHNEYFFFVFISALRSLQNQNRKLCNCVFCAYIHFYA